MPALTGARGAAQTASCVNNQRVLALDIALYRNDRGGVFPEWGVRVEDDDSDRCYDSSLSLAVLLPGYANTDAEFVCPATEHADTHGLRWRGNEATKSKADACQLTARFESWISESNDPDYLMDCEVGSDPGVTTAVLADGPDMEFLLNFFYGDGLDRQLEFEERSLDARRGGRKRWFVEQANHGPKGVVTMFWDSHVEVLNWNLEDPAQTDEYGSCPNPHIREDRDIFTYECYPENFQTDESGKLMSDCKLGNVDIWAQGRGPHAGSENYDECYWPGPDADDSMDRTTWRDGWNRQMLACSGWSEDFETGHLNLRAVDDLKNESYLDCWVLDSLEEATTGGEWCDEVWQ
jgi:hypothetical protein